MWFEKSEVERFDPERGYGRWMTFDQVVTRWTHYGFDAEFVEGLVADLHEDAHQHKSIELWHPGVPCPDEVTLYAVDPRTWRTNDVRSGLFQRWQVEEAERKLDLAPTKSISVLDHRVSELDKLLCEVAGRDSDFDRGAMPGTRRNSYDLSVHTQAAPATTY